MKKNGFTLIELIATIGLLGMLATILITVSVKKINETKEHSKKTMIESIELASKQYVTDYKDELSDFQKNDYIYISLQTLVEKNYFSNSLIDPTSNKSLPLTDTVYVTREQNGEISAVYDINQKEKAKITLNGSYNEYIKEGTTFTDLGVSAISTDGTDISSSVVKTGTVDSTTPGTYKIKYEYGDISIERNVIVYEGNLPTEIKIPVFITYNANAGAFSTTKYDYTGGEQTFTTPVNGYYKLEVWGAQGGTSSNYSSAFGGYGAYSQGTIFLKMNTVLFINSGGKGSNGENNSNNKSGGYNGGGTKVSPDAAYYSSSGGGATHIATISGILSSLSSHKVDCENLSTACPILIVAGGGGGGAGISGNYGQGGAAGGKNGNKGSNFKSNIGWGSGGTQTSAGCKTGSTTNGFCGSFGQGNSTSSGHGGAGGGGFYGGGSTNGDNIGGGGGGSGYIGNPLLANKYMYCYNCTTSDEADTKTYTTTNVSNTPISNYAKTGDGAAIINQITYEKKSVYLETYPINDIPVPTREGYTFIGWFTDPVSGDQITSLTKINNNNNHEVYAHWETAS